MALSATILIAGLAVAGCGGGGAVADDVARPVIDDVLKFAKRPAAPRPPSRLPAPVAATSAESDAATRFVICEGLGFYIDYGAFPTPGDWVSMAGGYVLSRVPAYRARQIGEEFQQVLQSPDPASAAFQLSHSLGCAG
jgi:hypothetical protein